MRIEYSAAPKFCTIWVPGFSCRWVGRGMRHVVLIPLYPHYLEWTRHLHACSPRGARVAKPARRVLRVSLRVLERVRLRIYKYTYFLFCVLVSFSYLLLPFKLILFIALLSLTLCTSGVSSVLSISFTKKTEQENRVTRNVEVALHLVTEVGSPHRGTPAS